MKAYRHIVASIFLALFCFMQLAELHVFSHDDGDTECQLCLISVDKQDDGFLPTEIIEVPSIIIIPADVVRSNYEQQYFTSTVNHSLLNKAPPTA
ncbi:hypothetical protein M0D21_18575 [Aquimarina sp. D1M17]|uniref:hypothetical protein n=1 Tax=Aquimarina acroporae TaxID=2937283 RepID=UPI0020C02063|nr:hypothetical protein [Aquimarina acroporae]MCK8523595.1 hypothetical protein [Aquimarina acroporae]